MKKLNLFLMLVMIGFGMIAQPAQAASTLSAAPDLLNQNNVAGPGFNARLAVAPYAQVVADDSYTFIGINHPSLASAHTTIGIVVEAMDMTTVPNTAAGRAAVFTISAGETHRVFVVNQSHATININNSSFTDTLTHLITTSDGDNFGNIRVTGVGTHPQFASNCDDRPGQYVDGCTIIRHDNVSQLSMWGVVYQSSNGAGFALEFVGDMHDSSVAASVIQYQAGGHETDPGTAVSYGAGGGRGIN